MLRSIYYMILAFLKGEEYDVAFEFEVHAIDLLFGIAVIVLMIVVL